MCVIVYKPAGTTITRRMLKACYETNDDGAGMAFAVNNRLYVSRGYFGFRRLYRYFRKIERTYPEANILLHFRLATSGGVSADKCHPFYVNENLAFAHNGVFPKMGSDVESDTQEFNRTILQCLPENFLKNEEIKNELERWCKETGSKLAFMDNKGEVTLLNEDGGVWEDGIWFSNMIWKWTNYDNYDIETTYDYGKNVYISKYQGRCEICGLSFPLSELRWDSVISGWMCETCAIRERAKASYYSVCSFCGGKYKHNEGKYVSYGTFYCHSCWNIIRNKTIVCPICGCNTVLDESGRCSVCCSRVDCEDLMFVDDLC